LSGNIISEYTLFSGQRIARRDVSSGNIYYIFSDRLGSYRTLTDSTGDVKGESDYYPFGAERVISSAVTDTFRFAGMEWDSEDGLNHTLYRQYTPAQCRWESTDPVRGCVMHPQGQNLYAYIRDNPTNSTDPNGDLFAVCDPNCVDLFFNIQYPGTCPSWCPPGMFPTGGGGGGGGGSGATYVLWDCIRQWTKPKFGMCGYTCWPATGFFWPAEMIAPFRVLQHICADLNKGKVPKECPYYLQAETEQAFFPEAADIKKCDVFPE